MCTNYFSQSLLTFFFSFIRTKHKFSIIFFQTPRTSDQPLSSSTNAKVQLFLWLGIEEYEPDIFRKLPAGFEMPSLPLQPELKNIRYRSKQLTIRILLETT